MRRSTTETPRWLKSSFSGGGDGNTCVEVAPLQSHVAIRDSKNPAHGTLTVPLASFTALVRSLKTPVN
ncbi:DUF397 domain-containing protein [Streptomyces sp. WAC 04229]|uniref:DUF397 domain-containing protein n=1 Tax=Streptomyces sp. WAC 04229 TaxID=2203206 RepID=UPI000F74551B|nr:DUF397 domain-containing protein [Streptomyces sp. WAC 04229]RSN48802.1 DUF397 domain-containing protein [Streptomyces sp. WAC 04229]